MAKSIVTVLALLTYAVFYALAYANDVAKYYGADIIFSAVFIMFLHFTFGFWKLNLPVYTLLVLSFASHLMGVFGWYNASPIFLQWDHVTHGFPLFAFTLFLFNFASQWMDKRLWTAKTWGVLLLVLLAALGIGAVIENIEFSGYLALGYGEGALFLGGPGDGVPITTAQMDVIDNLGGGYINTEIDLLWNALGAIVGLVLMALLRFRKPALSGTA
jgi:uncharacterized membrane protein YjdF